MMLMTQLKMMMLAMMLAILCQDSSALTNPDPVDYIISKLGNFFIAPGKTISTGEANITLRAKNTCECRTMCFVMTECIVWSFVQSTYHRSQCRMTTTTPREHTIVDHPTASYFFKSSAVGGEYSSQGDGLLYLKPPTEMKWQEAKAWCEEIPGHRLGIYKTRKQYDILESLVNKGGGSEFRYIDLQKSPNGPVWGDGTRLDDTEIKQILGIDEDNGDTGIFNIYYGKIHDEPLDFDRLVQFFCQVNPQHVEW